jgi:glycosyltransferase involved in cell wall biosynthesis
VQKSLAIMIISVIVATRNRCTSLAQLIEVLRQFPEHPTWELIVADNGSHDETHSLLAAAAATLPVVTIEEERSGKSRALNRAMKHARGDLLVFADDDIIPDRRWLTALHQASIEYPRANVFGSRILVDYQGIPKWVAASHSLKTMLTSEQELGDDICWFADGQYPVGPSIGVRRRVLESSRCEWPIKLGPGTKIPLGDERAFLMQLSPPEARDRLYVPSSIVRHNIAGRELNFMNAMTRCFLGGYAAGLIESRHGQSAAQRVALHTTAWHRIRRFSSAAELFCASARAFGMLAGRLSPYPDNLYG